MTLAMMPALISRPTSAHSPGAASTAASTAASPGACLDDLLASRFLPKRWTERIWSARELPPRLRRCTSDLKPGTEWRAYGEEGRIFFAADAPSTAIDACFLDESGSVYAAGVWDHDHRTGWCLDAVMEPSYDSEHGWWLGELMGRGGASR
jgi:hypothetical protein